MKTYVFKSKTIHGEPIETHIKMSQWKVLTRLLLEGKDLVAFDYQSKENKDRYTSVAQYGIGSLSQVFTRDVQKRFPPELRKALISERVPDKAYHHYYLDFSKLNKDDLCEFIQLFNNDGIGRKK